MKKEKIKKCYIGPIGVGSKVQKKLVGAHGQTQTHKGVVTMFDEHTNKIAVNFDDGDEVVLSLREVEYDEQDYTDEENENASLKVNKNQPGFYQYSIQWYDSSGQILRFKKPKADDPKRAVIFKTHAENIKFFGSWRKTRTHDGYDAFAIDIYAKWDNHHYTVSPIYYTDEDPRLKRMTKEQGEYGNEINTEYGGMRELSSDICTAINRWLYFHASGNLETITDLRNRADHPTIRFTSIQSLHSIITNLTDVFNKAIVSGGARTVKIVGDYNTDTEILCQLDFTSEIVNNKFRTNKYIIPSLPDIEVVENIPSKEAASKIKEDEPNKTTIIVRSQKSKGKISSPKVQGTISELKSRLDEIQAKPKRERTPEQQKEEKKIRELMRKLGHKGGIKMNTPKID